uniref:Uncharacterized protein n=1 Tax=Rhizophora mucronata TaxID=61149 RepID=A0A2P2P7C3_RHIMU
MHGLVALISAGTLVFHTHLGLETQDAPKTTISC